VHLKPKVFTNDEWVYEHLNLVVLFKGGWVPKIVQLKCVGLCAAESFQISKQSYRPLDQSGGKVTVTGHLNPKASHEGGSCTVHLNPTVSVDWDHEHVL
jgi:hypothetical protein